MFAVFQACPGSVLAAIHNQTRPSRATWDECFEETIPLRKVLRSYQIFSDCQPHFGKNSELDTVNMAQSFKNNINNFIMMAAPRVVICTHHKNSGSNWKPACTLPLLPLCPTLKDGQQPQQPDPLGPRSRASNGSGDSHGDSVRAATEPDWCGVARAFRVVFSRSVRSKSAGISGESARLLCRQQSWMPRIQTSKLRQL